MGVTWLERWSQTGLWPLLRCSPSFQALDWIKPPTQHERLAMWLTCLLWIRAETWSRNITILRLWSQILTIQNACACDRLRYLNCWTARVRTDQAEKHVARLDVVAEDAEHGWRHRLAVDLLDATHDHAHVRGLDDDADALRLDSFAHGQRDLFGDALLQLQPAAVDLDDACQLGQTEHFAVGDVADRHLAQERHQVVFAQREHFDVFHHDHLVVVLVEHGSIQLLCPSTPQEMNHLIRYTSLTTTTVTLSWVLKHFKDLTRIPTDYVTYCYYCYVIFGLRILTGSN